MSFLKTLVIQKKEGIEQHRKQECSKAAKIKGKVYLLMVKKLALKFLLVCTCGNFLVPVFVAAYTVNNLDLGNNCLVPQHQQGKG